MAFPARFKATAPDLYAEHLRERLLLECESLLADDPAPYAAPLAELSRTLLDLLTPQSLHPGDANNTLLRLERAYWDGVAELEQAGHRAEGLSLYEYVHRLSYLEKKRAA